MTQIRTRLHIFGALAALTAVTSLAIPAVPALAEGSEQAPTALAGDEQRAASLQRPAANSTDRPSFIFPATQYVQGLGWEIDSGGPAVRMEYLGDE